MTNENGIPQKNEKEQYEFADVVFVDLFMTAEEKLTLLESADDPAENRERIDYIKTKIKQKQELENE